MEGSRSLEGKVIVVTGAGRGIGRDVALQAAAEGAHVVVNDLGAGADGEGAPQTQPAEAVVAEIAAAGGSAVASFDTVAEPEAAERIVQTAIDAFGRVDAVVNNAGILRDRVFHRMGIEDWKLVIDVHLMGSFYVARAAAPHFREQESGAFVHFTSTTGLIGNLGQANYAAAKAGVVALSKSIALDMARFGVRSNCIGPFAWSRLIGTIPPRGEEEVRRIERLKAMSADKVAPLAVFLAGDLSEGISGQIFVMRQNEVFLMSQSRPVRSLHRAEGWTPRTLAEQMAPAFRPSFYPLERTADVFAWEPV